MPSATICSAGRRSLRLTSMRINGGCIFQCLLLVLIQRMELIFVMLVAIRSVILLLVPLVCIVTIRRDVDLGSIGAVVIIVAALMIDRCSIRHSVVVISIQRVSERRSGHGTAGGCYPRDKSRASR